MDLPLIRKLQEFLQEDVGHGDVTTDILIPPGIKAKAVVKAKEEGVIAGIEEATLLLKNVGIEATPLKRDGEGVKEGEAIMELVGKARTILTIERFLLNLLSHMSGVATMTSIVVREAKSVSVDVRVAATRKTLPGLRLIQKRAVTIGGGDSHRFDLSDMILIKDNHIAIVGSVGKAIRLVKSKASFTQKVEVEVSTIKDALVAARSGADIIMLDNVSPNDVKEIVNTLKRKGLRDKVILEVSGRITVDNIAEYARLDIDVVSMGMLTHSVKALDLSLEITKVVKTSK